jgi:2-oxo-4-hydroxy-4-carboxy-5-ureidoimidazoline decarboxylase
LINVKRTLALLNAQSRGGFVKLIGPVFEHSPWIAHDTWQNRPFSDLNELHFRLCDTVKAAGQEKQLALIRAHPDLVGRAALAGELTASSNAEQASAGLNRLTSDEIAVFQKCNHEYHDKFRFPFVICARLNRKEAILNGFRGRMKNTRDQEIQTALEEIFKIARLRLEDIVEGG